MNLNTNKLLIFITSLLMIIFISCEKEIYGDEFQQKQKITISEKSFKELINEPVFRSAYQRIPKKKKLVVDASGRSAFEDQFGFTIIEQAPVKIINDNGEISYTLLILSDDNSDNKLENLVLAANATNESIGYIAKYNVESNTKLNAFQIQTQGVFEVKPLSSNTYARCDTIVLEFYTCSAMGTDDDCSGADNNASCFKIFRYVLSCSGLDPAYSTGTSTPTGGTMGGGAYSGGVNTSPTNLTPSSINLAATLSLTPEQEAWINLPENNKIEEALQKYIFENSPLLAPYDSPIVVKTLGFAKQLLDFCRANSSITSKELYKWFLTPTEGQDDEYNTTFWDNPTLTFTQQALPTRLAFVAGIPKNENGTLIKDPDRIYEIAGGDVLGARNDDQSVGKIKTRNTCALKISIALNRSGVVIPYIPNETVEGGGEFAGKFFFLNAKALNQWMRKTFGTNPATATTPYNPNHLSIPIADGGINGINFPNLPVLHDISGIYSIVLENNEASGHADYIYTNTQGNVDCAGGCFFNLKIQRMDIWILN